MTGRPVAKEKERNLRMFTRRANVHTAAVAVAAVASLASPALAGTLSSTATGAGVATPTTAHRTVRPPIGLTTSTPCGGARRPPVSLPPVTAPPVFTPGPPAAPGLCQLQASQADVVVSWYNRSVTAGSFIVYRLNSQGNRQVVDQVAALTGARRATSTRGPTPTPTKLGSATLSRR